MRYVQARNGVFERHITDKSPTQWDKNNYCLARRLDPKRAEELGVYKLKLVSPPPFDPATQKRVEKDAVFVDGRWTQVYAVEALSEEERTAYRDELARSVRSRRDNFIAETDWMALNDNTLSPAWASYRQALRDITEQTGFPYSVVWPAKPE